MSIKDLKFEELYDIQVDVGISPYKVGIKENKAYIYILDKETSNYNLKGYIDFIEKLVDVSNPKSLLLLSKENKYVYIGHKIYILDFVDSKFESFICINKGPFNIPYGFTKNWLYGFTENLAVEKRFVNGKNPFDFFHNNEVSSYVMLTLTKIYKEIYDDSFSPKGIRPITFLKDKLVFETNSDKVVVHKNKINNYTFEHLFIGPEKNNILALLEKGKKGYNKYLFISPTKTYEFISSFEIMQYFSNGCHYAYGRYITYYCFESGILSYVKNDLNPIEFIKYVSLFYKPMKPETFEKEVEFPFIPNVYYIHDNGGRPFRVSINRDSKTASIDESNEEDEYKENYKGLEWKNILNIKYLNVYVGENNEEDENLDSGNSILFQLSKHKYLIVMSVIAEINIDDEIKEFYTRDGGSDTFLPYGISDKYIYVFYDGLIVKIEKTKLKKINGVFDIYNTKDSLSTKITYKPIKERKY